MTEPLVTVNHVGQEFLDEPVFAHPKKLDAALALAFTSGTELRPIHVGHERVRLQWMKPDGKGGLVPR